MNPNTAGNSVVKKYRTTEQENPYAELSFNSLNIVTLTNSRTPNPDIEIGKLPKTTTIGRENVSKLFNAGFKDFITIQYTNKFSK